MALAINRVRLNQLHKYLYAQANPVMNIDPSGWLSLTGVAGAVTTGVGMALEGAGIASAVYGLAQFVVSGYHYIQATYGLMTTDAGDFDTQLYYANMQVNALEGMLTSTAYVAGGAMAAWAGSLIKGAGLAMMALTGPAAVNTVHGAQRLLERGFTQADIAAIRTGKVLTQSDGAKVFIKEVAPGKFNVVVEGTRGIITALKGISQKSLDRLANNYGWYE